jgi:hypothetical protein
MNLTAADAERAALMSRVELPALSRSRSLEIVARRLGHRDWRTASAGFARGLGNAVPVPRVPDVSSALPGSVVRVPVTDIRALRRELSAKDHPPRLPVVDEDTPVGPALAVTDPFATVLRFFQEVCP